MICFLRQGVIGFRGCPRSRPAKQKRGVIPPPFDPPYLKTEGQESVSLDYGKNVAAYYFWIFPNIWIFGLLDIVEGTMLKIPIFRHNLEFSDFQPDFPSERSYMDFTVHVCKQKVHIWAVRTTYF